MKLSRLPGRKNCERLQRQGVLWKGKHLWIRWARGAPRHPAIDPARTGVYMGSVASAKLHKSAVKRNRMRRRCREALRTLLGEQEDFGPLQLLIIPRSSSLSAPFSDIQRDVRAFLSSVHGQAR